MGQAMLGAVLHGAKDLRIESRTVPELRSGQVLIRVRRAGICGSDLHYFNHGYCGSFIPTGPFVLGHELVGEVERTFGDVTDPAPGARVVVNPARPCGFCAYCKAGRGNLCAKTVMLGSASTNPPTDGAFAEFVVVRADQCHVVPTRMDDSLAAMIEPLAVALHAVKRAGTVSGKSVLVTGGGPIGLLVAMTAKAYGAMPVAVSEVMTARRERALALGAHRVLDPSSAAVMNQVSELTGNGFDVVFEASGAPRALRQAFDLVRRGGKIVQIGTVGTADIPLPANQVMVGEIQFIGSFRYGDVFSEAIQLALSGLMDLQLLVSGIFPLGEIVEALKLATGKEDTLKVQVQI